MHKGNCFFDQRSECHTYFFFPITLLHLFIAIYPASYQENWCSFYFARQTQSAKWSLINPEACKWA